jgi:hypothetical protein
MQFIGIIKQKIMEEKKKNMVGDSSGNCTFKPHVNLTSQQIAENYRAKLQEHVGAPMSTIEVLTQATNKEEWRERAKEILKEEEMKNCTFKPQTNDYKPTR